MRRRDFINALGTLAVRPLAASAQQPAMPVVGYLSSGTSAGFASLLGAFQSGLGEAGYVEGRNVTFQYRWAEGQEDRLRALVADLISRQVVVIVATGGLHPAVVAKVATSTIPILFTGGGDPQKYGLVASLARPGENATGAINFSPVVTAKRLELLRELLPTGGMIAVLINPTDPSIEARCSYSDGVRLQRSSPYDSKIKSSASSSRGFMVQPVVKQFTRLADIRHSRNEPLWNDR